MTARGLVGDAEIKRIITLARAEGLDFTGLDVGRDYVRLIPPQAGGDSIAHYIGDTHSPKRAGRR